MHRKGSPYKMCGNVIFPHTAVRRGGIFWLCCGNIGKDVFLRSRGKRECLTRELCAIKL